MDARNSILTASIVLAVVPTGCDRPAKDDHPGIDGTAGGAKCDFALGTPRMRQNGRPGLFPTCSGGVARMSVSEPHLGSTEVHIPTSASHCMNLGSSAIV